MENRGSVVNYRKEVSEMSGRKSKSSKIGLSCAQNEREQGGPREVEKIVV